MNDSEVKKIIDRVPRRIRRKGVADINAHLPAVHLFAANDLPRSLDGASHAYGKRIVIITMGDYKAPPGTLRDFERVLWDTESEGILAFAIEGLRRLARQGGLFTIPASSLRSIAELEAESDIVGLFLKAVEEGEVMDKNTTWVLDKEASIEGPKLWEVFSSWMKANDVEGLLSAPDCSQAESLMSTYCPPDNVRY